MQWNRARPILIPHPLSPVLVLAVFFLPSLLCAGGKTETTEKQPLNSGWVLCVTDFDISALPLSRQSVGNVFTRSLVDTFKVLGRHIRLSPEYAYYEGYAWSQSRSSAARALAAKRDERALILYRGEPEWKYRQNIKKIDGEIAKLQEDLAKAESEMPPVNREPSFSLTQGNKDGNYPAAPQSGGEYRFCRTQNADAFLAGAIREYHGRYYVTLRLFALYTRSYIYEDDIIFSADDLAAAVEEIAGRLIAVLGGSKPAAVAVHAEPAETLVLINRNFAGRGEVETREYPPEKITVTMSADGYESETVETNLSPGELTVISANLNPLPEGGVYIGTADSGGASVYRGALYVGEAPLTLRLPLNQLEYISLENPAGESAKAVFTSPGRADDSFSLSMNLKAPFPAGQDRVNKARRAYYWAWGGTWITGIAAWIAYGVYTSYAESIRDGYYNYGIINDKFERNNQGMYYVSMGTVIVVGLAVGYEIFQMVRYLYTATEDTTPIIRPGRQESKK
jgi:hypothetical protein